MLSLFTNVFELLAVSYIVLALAHFGVQFVLAHLNYRKQQHEAPQHAALIEQLQQRQHVPPISVIYPIYNEDPIVLRRVLEHAQRCLSIPNLELIFVDDGSPNVDDLRSIYEQFRHPRLHIVYCDNGGKRAAQYRGMQDAKGDYIVTVDSDTLINIDCIYKILAPMLLDPSLGAVTGDVRVENAQQNILTHLISLRYWLAFNLERAAQSLTGAMLCCSGPLAIYRGDVLHRVKERYIQQRFLGELCTYGDDRHLTNLILAEGCRTRFQQEAIAYTYVPTNLRQYIVQQTRWNKSFYRELFWTLKAWRHMSLYSLADVIVQVLLFPLALVAIAYHLFSFLNTLAIQVVVAYILLVILMASVRSLYGLLRTRKLAYLWFICYGFIHVAVLMPVRFKALLTLKNNRWGTRGGKYTNGYGNFMLWMVAYLTTILSVTVLIVGMVPNRVGENIRSLALNTSLSMDRLVSGVVTSWLLAAPCLLALLLLFVGRLRWVARTEGLHPFKRDLNMALVVSIVLLLVVMMNLIQDISVRSAIALLTHDVTAIIHHPLLVPWVVAQSILTLFLLVRCYWAVVSGE